MKIAFQKTWPVAAALLAGLWLASAVEAQQPNVNPFSNRNATREARIAYLANQRAKASVPVNYSFPVRADAATAYNAVAYSPQYQYSMHPGQAAYRRPSSASSPNTRYRPVPNPNGYSEQNALHADGRRCPRAQRPPRTTQRPDLYGDAGAYVPSGSVNGYGSDNYVRPYVAAYTPNGRYAHATSAAYRNTAGTNADPYYYVGKSTAGPATVYPKDEPIRNVLRYLFP